MANRMGADPLNLHSTVVCLASMNSIVGGADVFLDLTTRLGQDFVDILSGS